MSISGPLPPSGGANRIANSYGFTPKRAPAPPAASHAPAGPNQAEAAEAAGSPGSLRAVLNDEERAYFDQIAALGPITYGPGSKAAGLVPDVPRGLRLDVRG